MKEQWATYKGICLRIPTMTQEAPILITQRYLLPDILQHHDTNIHSCRRRVSE